MWLIQMCLRWLTPANTGIESPATPVVVAQPAIKKIVARQPIGLAPILAPPPPRLQG